MSALRCRVAVVDDDAHDRHEIARSLRTVRARYSLGEPVEIEEFGDAHEVARRIRVNPHTPPWDIVLADVLMPHPQTGRDEHLNGGFHVARAIAETYGAGPVPIKLALVTSKPGVASTAEQLRTFDTAENAAWFWFFLKGASVTRTVRGSETLLPATVWQLALAQMIALRNTERWGLKLLHAIPTTETVPRVFRSAAAQAALTGATQLGGNLALRAAVVVGEPGAGVDLLAYYLHVVRSATLTDGGAFVVYDAGSTRPETAGEQLFGADTTGAYAVPLRGKVNVPPQATLFIKAADKLPPEVQARLAGLVAGTAPGAPRFAGQLLVLGAEPSSRGAAPHSPPGILFERLRAATIHVPGLAERREDIVPAAEIFLGQLSGDATPRLTRDARRWLASPERYWPENFLSLFALLAAASEWGARRAVARRDLARAAERLAFDRQPEPSTGVSTVAKKAAQLFRAIQEEDRKRGAVWKLLGWVIAFLVAIIGVYLTYRSLQNGP